MPVGSRSSLVSDRVQEQRSCTKHQSRRQGIASVLFAKVDCSCASFLLLDKLNTRLGKGPMKKEKFKPILLFLLVIVLFMMMISCAHTPGVIGKWREIGKTATLEFSKDGSFKAVDNQGMAVSGKYTLFENGNVRFEIAHPGSSSEIVIGKLSMREDRLTISFKNGHEVERYRRVK